jgi:hypothetical protein
VTQSQRGEGQGEGEEKHIGYLHPKKEVILQAKEASRKK